MRTLRRAKNSSMLLASHTVQVTTEAKASPTITACTTMSAEANIDQGERSRGRCDDCALAARVVSLTPITAAEGRSSTPIPRQRRDARSPFSRPDTAHLSASSLTHPPNSG